MHKISMPKVEEALRELQKDFPRINKMLDVQRDEMSDAVVQNMLCGYGYVNWLLEKGRDPFKNTAEMLELNHRVLMGDDERTRLEYNKSILHTREHFEENSDFVLHWYRKHENDGPWKRAAGVYVRGVSAPQLFYEGNHRTGSLLVSYILVSNGHPPFVLTAKNALGYFNPSSLIKKQNKRKMMHLMFKLPGLKEKFREFLKEETKLEFLVKNGKNGNGKNGKH